MTVSIPTSSPPQRSPIPSWRFWFPLMLQLLLILPVPLRNAYVAVAGQSIVLETMAVDPYDIFRGHSQTLLYKISDPETFEKLPGYDLIQQQVQAAENPEGWRDRPQTQAVYVVLNAPSGKIDLSAEQSPTVWQPVRLERDRPQDLSPDQIALRATSDGDRILYNLEQYYMPEDRRNEINDTIQELQRSDIGDVKLEAKVDRSGKAIPVALWLGDRRYQF